MTRPKADSDPWLTDMVTRDREVAKTVVYGFRTIISLLRDIRDVLGEESRASRTERQQMREEMAEMYRQIKSLSQNSGSRVRAMPFEACDHARCSLPKGHLGNHRGFLRDS